MSEPCRNCRAIICAGLLVCVSGCSASRADRGALFGGLAGAGVGALVGDAVGDTAAGAIIGAGLGTVTGAAIGGSLDEIEARNRAQIEAQLGREVAAGAASVEDIVAMTASGVDEEVVLTHIRIHGVNRPLETHDLIYLQQSGVSSRVIQAMQQTPTPKKIVASTPSPPRVIVEEHYYHRPYYAPPARHYHHHHRRPRSGVSWGLSFSSR